MMALTPLWVLIYRADTKGVENWILGPSDQHQVATWGAQESS